MRFIITSFIGTYFYFINIFPSCRGKPFSKGVLQMLISKPLRTRSEKELFEKEVQNRLYSINLWHIAHWLLDLAILATLLFN